MSLPDNTNIDNILDRLCNELDSLGYLAEEVINRHIDEVRKVNPNCADELEKSVYKLVSDERYGVGASHYAKTNVIRPIQRKYRDADNP